jgi:hypothetical protein
MIEKIWNFDILGLFLWIFEARDPCGIIFQKPGV